MSSSGSRTRFAAIAIAGVVLLAACGGSGDSRTRNEALVQGDDCYATEQAKTDAVAAATAARDAVAPVDIAALEAEAQRLSRAAAEKWNEFLNHPLLVDRQMNNDDEVALYNRLAGEYDALRLQAIAAGAAMTAGYRALDQRTNLDEALAAAEAKSVCAGAIAAPSSTENSTDDVTTTSNSDTTSTQAEESTTTSVDTSESTTDAPTTSAGSVDGAGGVDGTNPAAECRIPVQDGGYLLAKVGERITITVPLCSSLANPAVAYGFPGPVQLSKIETVGSDRVLTLTSDEPASVQMFLYHYDSETFDSGPRSTFKVTFQGDDPCPNAEPTAEWDEAKDGGTFIATSTCEGIQSIETFVSRLSGDNVRSTVFHGFVSSGFAYTDLIQAFGEGEYEVVLVHARVDENVVQWYGKRTTLNVIYTPAPATGNTVTSGGVVDTSRVPGVIEVPMAVFTPEVSTQVENPRAVDPRVPVIAVPTDAAVMTCGEACISNAISIAGLESGIVEIAFGEGPWQTVNESWSAGVSSGATKVRVRVTPDDGAPVEMSAVVTRESIDDAYAEVEVTGRSDSPATGVDTSSSTGSGLPWWVIALIAVVVLAGAAAVVRRRGARTA